MERKFIDLKDLKLSDEEPGVIEGYRSVFGVLDEGGDIILKGAFSDTVEDFLREGFTAHSHDWNFDKAVGFPIEAREDDHGWFVRSQFHSTPDAQAIRTKAKERLAAGKQVGFSFGYQIDDFSEIQSKDFDSELSKYVPADQLDGALTKAKKFPRIRILKKLSVIEDSIVTAPMNRSAAATAVKDKPIQITIVDEEETDQERIIEADKSNLKEKPVSDSFESFESAVSAIEKFAEKMRVYHELRTKDGRVLSATNRAKVQSAYDALGALLEASTPPPKEKEIDVETLRTQSLRARSLAVRALAQPPST